ncbi:MAG: response regulator with CheY-like receiver domain and winged-helix DNA-binding domain [Thermomicrobiales bacterium]|nr:response regulator with CheY-like receiver domain and winged-helix DNA-binding domain [Thermomicrobiales bacterium]MDF3037428.1 response regulator with CheY-like receiver domain and winged-helix DNA-binding domain [Thermomicrobiales bacterium]
MYLPIVRFGDLEIDILHRRARIEGRDLRLTSLELGLLYLLAANGGRVLTRDEILDDLWGVDHVAESNVVDRHVRSLRAKLRDDWRRPRFIATVPGRGYCFVLPAADDISATALSRAPPPGAARSPGARRREGMTKPS